MRIAQTSIEEENQNVFSKFSEISETLVAVEQVADLAVGEPLIRSCIQTKSAGILVQTCNIRVEEEERARLGFRPACAKCCFKKDISII